MLTYVFHYCIGVTIVDAGLSEVEIKKFIYDFRNAFWRCPDCDWNQRLEMSIPRDTIQISRPNPVHCPDHMPSKADPYYRPLEMLTLWESSPSSDQSTWQSRSILYTTRDFDTTLTDSSPSSDQSTWQSRSIQNSTTSFDVTTNLSSIHTIPVQYMNSIWRSSWICYSGPSPRYNGL